MRLVPAAPAHQALTVVGVAPVQRHRQPAAARERVADGGDEHLLARQPALELQHRLVQRHQRLGGALVGDSLLSAPVVHLAAQQVPQQAVILTAIHLAQQGRELAMIGAELAHQTTEAALALQWLRSHRAAVVADGLRHIGGDGIEGPLVLRRQQPVLEPAQVLDLPHRVNQAAEFLDGHVLPGLGGILVQQIGRDVRLDPARHLLVIPLPQRLGTVNSTKRAVAQVVAIQQRIYLVGVLGIQRGRTLVELAQVAHILRTLLARLVCRARQVVLDQMVALLGRRHGKIARIHRLG